MRWRAVPILSSCAITKPNTGTSIWTHATCIRAKKIVARRLDEELGKARASNEIISTPFEERYARRIAGLMRWPD